MPRNIILRDKDTGASMLVDFATGSVKRLDADSSKSVQKSQVVEYRSVAPARMFYREEREAA